MRMTDKFRWTVQVHARGRGVALSGAIKSDQSGAFEAGHSCIWRLWLVKCTAPDFCALWFQALIYPFWCCRTFEEDMPKAEPSMLQSKWVMAAVAVAVVGLGLYTFRDTFLAGSVNARLFKVYAFVCRVRSWPSLLPPSTCHHPVWKALMKGKNCMIEQSLVILSPQAQKKTASDSIIG